MKHPVIVLVTASAVCLAALLAMSQDKPAYVGVDKCKICHKIEKTGNQYGIWLKTKHAQAFETLKGQQSKDVAKKLKIADPLTSEKCLKCHITAPAFQAEGVGCEACHGPGSLYKTITVMKDKAKAMTLGLIDPNEKLCLKCHNTESPTYKKFVFAEAVKVGAHPIPGRK